MAAGWGPPDAFGWSQRFRLACIESGLTRHGKQSERQLPYANQVRVSRHVEQSKTVCVSGACR